MQPLFEDSSLSPSAYSLALYSGLWAFGGWDQANYIAGEIKNPGRNIPRVIHWSMAAVMVSVSSAIHGHITHLPQTLFFLANVSYLVVLDKETVGLSNTVALDFGRALLGPMGGMIFALMVAISCFGALNCEVLSCEKSTYPLTLTR